MPQGIVCTTAGGYDICVKDDGEDYWRIVKACIDENIDQDELIRNHPAKAVFAVKRDGVELGLHPLVYTNPKRMVFRVEMGERRFILKRARMGTVGFKRLLPGIMGLTYFTRIMRKVNRAVLNGCDATQDYLLVAEKGLSAFRQEAWLLLGYVEGESLGGLPLEPHRRELARTVEELIGFDLTMDDLTLHNFLVDGGGRVRGIDISCRPFTRLHAVKMVMKLNAQYGLNLPVRGLANNLVRAALALRYRIKKVLGFGEP